MDCLVMPIQYGGSNIMHETLMSVYSYEHSAEVYDWNQPISFFTLSCTVYM